MKHGFFTGWLNADYWAAFSRFIALFSFFTGTALFVLWSNTYETDYAMLGFFFLIGAIITNLIVLTVLLFFMVSKSQLLDKLSGSLFFILLNIPYSILYYIMQEEIFRSLYID